MAYEDFKANKKYYISYSEDKSVHYALLEMHRLVLDTEANIEKHRKQTYMPPVFGIFSQ